MSRLLDPAKYQDSFISSRPIATNHSVIRQHGIEEFVRLEMEKLKFLRHLIDHYDDGRSKSFYCTSCQLVPLDKLKEALADVETKITEDIGIKEKAKIVRTAINRVADDLQIDLKLRK